MGDRLVLTDCVPQELAKKAAAGEIDAGPMPLIEYLRQKDRFERITRFGVAVRGRVESASLFSLLPLRQLTGRTIAVTEQSSMTATLLRLLLEVRYHIQPGSYTTERRDEADALLLIGDEALRRHYADKAYPFETDMAFEWWLWQHMPCVFAVWVVRKTAGDEQKRYLEKALARALAVNQGRMAELAKVASEQFDIPAENLQRYLENFVYRFGPDEEQAIERFEELVNEHRLL